MKPQIGVVTLGVDDLNRSLVRDTLGVPSPTEFSLGYLASSKDEVDQILNDAKDPGATLTDAAHDRPWGIYSGYFKDPDGHLWEVIWKPS